MLLLYLSKINLMLADFVFPFLQPLKLKGLGKELFYQEVNYCMRQSSLMGSMIGENEQ